MQGTFDGRDVAVKKQDKFDAQGEIEVLGKLQHANVVKLIYTKMERNFAYMILELCLGSLRNVIRGERDGLADYEMVKLLTDTTHGFDYLVERRVYHGDIKPENVLMDTNGNYKFADFGLSTVYKDVERLTDVVGTDEYCHPLLFEHWRQLHPGTKRPFNCSWLPTVDIWSLGVMYYEAAARVNVSD